MTKPAASPTETDTPEKISPFIESAIVELALLAIKQITTPLAVLFYTKEFRDQILVFHKDELNARYLPLIARPLTFYVLWMAVHILLAGPYWHFVLRDNARRYEHDPSNFLPNGGSLVFEAIKSMADYIGQAGALIVVATAITLVIGVKAACVTSIGRLIGCRVRLRTVLFASAYTMGTLLFFQYAIILSRYAIAAMLSGTLLQTAGYYILIYGSLVICIVLTVRVNQMIQAVDGTRETPTFVAWFMGTLIWLYLIILASGAALRTYISVATVAKLFVNAFIPNIFPDISL
jgi:hypothetical protein